MNLGLGCQVQVPNHTQQGIPFSKYQVSSDGQVCSKKRDGWRMLKNVSMSDGRLFAVSLCRVHDQRLDDQRVARIHRLTLPVLVLYSFTDNSPPVYLPIKYHDDSTRNARFENLSFGYRGVGHTEKLSK
ncbi:predicted protein [Lichtheimia corymbifera JMRC:FSU:9682]|uniref:Uncharacterized protein n=1 Tax=Lichtheimia corymbifera JMRC:FSU:9682 TaxID=1263082 RepID=A0A068RNQ0_9FUNG|nr:predicted protein [Lichtheimia corymbifera JMRC:FSU:9682]